jgi:major membrane immunogen (membrane-anchored lipoprotein)
MDEPHYFTHIRYYTRNEILERINSELWLDIESMFSDEIENTIDNENYKFLEQITEFDFNNDGYAEPVLVTVHEQSGKVVRVMAMFDNDSLAIKYNDRISSYDDIVQQIVNQEPQPFVTPEEHLEFIDNEIKSLNKKAKVICINPIKTVTHYRFQDSADCSLLGYGFQHLMASSMKAINKATNSLFNAGDLANLQSGWLSSEHKEKRKGSVDFKPGQWRQTNIASQDLAGSAIPLPVKEPSTVLLQLNEQLKAETNAIGNKTDINELMSPNIPAASVLGVLQEGAIPTSALLFRTLNSMSEEFNVLYELNARYTDPIQYQKLNDGANYEDDYSEELFIKPTANAKFSNQAQRIQMATAEMEQIPMIMQAGGNVLPIIEGYFESLGSDKYDAVFNKEPSPEEQAQMQQMQQAQEQQNQLIQKQNQMIEAELQLRNKELEIKDSESSAKIATMQAEQERKDIESQAKLAELEAKIQQMEVQNIKTIQEAEKINAETGATEAQQMKTITESAAAIAESGIKQIEISSENN